MRSSPVPDDRGDGGAPTYATAPVRQVRRLPFGAPGGGSVARSRTFVRNTMQAFGWVPPPDEHAALVLDDVLLVAVELVTNACLHADGPIELRIVRGPESLRIEVDDSSPNLPAPRPPHADLRPGGHGLNIIRRLSQDWGVTARPGEGKTVWADMPLPVAPRPPAAS